MEVKMRSMPAITAFGLLIWLIWTGCATTFPPMLPAGEPITPMEGLEKYGAYYEYDELRIVVNEFDSHYDTGITYALNQKIRIVNRKGVKHGTLEVRRLSQNLSGFELRLIDAAGRDVSMDTGAIRQKYLDTGSVVVPKVEPGCQIILKMTFLSDKFLHNYEHWFRKPIPVLKGRFALFRPAEFIYESRTHGSIQPAEHLRVGPAKGVMWDSRHILPDDNSPDLFWQQDTGPSVLVRLTDLSTPAFNYEAPDWKGLASRYQSYFISPSMLTYRPRIKKQVEDILDGITDKTAQAEAILDYVTNEITLADSGSVNTMEIDIQKVLKLKKGDRWDMTVVLKEMFDSMGFQTRVYVTRPHDLGGFDPEFPSWRYLSIPLVSVVIDGRELIAYHYLRSANLGEYPDRYFDLDALDLQAGKIAELPEPLHRQYAFSTHATISLPQWDQVHDLTYTYGRYAGMFMRSKLMNRSGTKRRKFFIDVIEQYDERNQLARFRVSGLDDRGDVEVTLGMKNTGFKTSQAGRSHYSLAPWYTNLFQEIDPRRHADCLTSLNMNLEQTLLIKTQDRPDVSVHFECLPIDNLLFSQVCGQEKTDDGYLLKRKVTRKKTRLSYDQLASIMPDIEKLNRISESYVIHE